MGRKQSQVSAWEGLKVIHPNAAGWYRQRGVLGGGCPGAHRRAGAQVRHLYAGSGGPADRLIACGVGMVALDSTGVYGIPVYEFLEARGLKVRGECRYVKNVPGARATSRLSVAAGVAQRGVVARPLPPRRRFPGVVGLPAPAGDAD